MLEVVTSCPLELNHSSLHNYFVLALYNLGDVEIKEVGVQNRLNNSGNDRDDIIEALEIVSVDPVENIESSVCAQGKKIVGCDGFGFACFLDHEKLGQDGHRFQINRKGPQNFH